MNEKIFNSSSGFLKLFICVFFTVIYWLSTLTCEHFGVQLSWFTTTSSHTTAVVSLPKIYEHILFNSFRFLGKVREDYCEHISLIGGRKM